MATNLEEAARARAERPAHVPADRVYEIDMYALDGIEGGYHEAWKRVQHPGIADLIWTPFTGGHWIATNGDTVKEVYSDPERFSSEIIFLPKEAGEKYQMVPTRMDPPEHTPYRKTLDKGLNLAQIRKVEDKVRQVAGELIARFADRGACDFAADYAGLFPVYVFMALADLPLEDIPVLNKFARQMTRPEGNTPEEMAIDLQAGNDGFYDYVDPIIRSRIGGTGDDLITQMVNTEINGKPIAHDKAQGLISLLLLGGLDTVVNFLSFFMIHLAKHPALVAELRSDPLKLMRGAEEMFRRFPVVSEARMVAKDQDYKGVSLKRGDMILLPTALHGLDDALNPEPWKLDLGRRSISHSTFGGGPHRCAGMHLARMEVIVTLEEWLKRIPVFSLKEGASPTYHSGIVAARNAESWYEEGCNFAFHGWARDPNEWVAVASWKSEEFVNRMRQTDWYKDTQQRMLECSRDTMIMEQLSGMNCDRSVFDEYPAGSSQVHMKTHSLDVVFL